MKLRYLFANISLGCVMIDGIHRTRDELYNQLMLLEGKHLRAEVRQRRFEERIDARERLTARTVRLGEQQLQTMQQWIGEALESIEKTSEKSFTQLRDQVVDALLMIAKQLEEDQESQHLDSNTDSIKQKTRR